MYNRARTAVAATISKARTVARTAGNVATNKVRRLAWASGRGAVTRMMTHYKLSPNERRNFMNAYNQYRNALNNTRPNNARRNAQQAATKFTNTMFKVYNKASHKSTPVSNGIRAGVQKSVVYWVPGIIYRSTFHRKRPASV